MNPINNTTDDMNPIIKTIADDLKIYQLKNETKGFFEARVIYSAIAQHMKAASNDASIYEPITSEGASIVHTKKRCRDILEQLVLCSPSSKDWFDYKNNNLDSIIEIIYSRLVMAGELLKNRDRYNVSATIKRFIVNDRVCYYRGIATTFSNKKASGLSLIENTTASYEDRSSIKELLPNSFENADKYWKEYISHISFEKIYSIDNLEIFDADMKTSTLYNCFKSVNSIPKGISLVRKKLYEFDYCYYIVKRVGDSVYYHSVEDYYKETNEHFRFRYALRNLHNNPVKARFNLCGDMVKLHLDTKLPNSEMAFLSLISWPERNINDDVFFIFSSVYWDIIKRILENLHIELTEMKNETI